MKRHVRVRGGAFPQPTRGFHSTILKELGRNKNIREAVRVNKTQKNKRHIGDNGSWISSHLTKSGDLEMTC